METVQIGEITEQSRIHCIKQIKHFPPEKIHKCQLQCTKQYINPEGTWHSAYIHHTQCRYWQKYNFPKFN